MPPIVLQGADWQHRPIQVSAAAPLCCCPSRSKGTLKCCSLPGLRGHQQARSWHAVVKTPTILSEKTTLDHHGPQAGRQHRGFLLCLHLEQKTAFVRVEAGIGHR